MIKECVCPKCSEIITELNFKRIKEDSGSLYFENGIDLIDFDSEPMIIEEKFVCPECGELLFIDFNAAYRFLKKGCD